MFTCESSRNQPACAYTHDPYFVDVSNCTQRTQGHELWPLAHARIQKMMQLGADSMLCAGEFTQENEQMDTKQEMMDDALDGLFDDDNIEEEADSVTQQVQVRPACFVTCSRSMCAPLCM